MSKMRTEEEIINKMFEAEKVMRHWEKELRMLTATHGLDKAKNRKDFMEAVRNYNALRGVVKTCHYMLGNQECPLI